MIITAIVRRDDVVAHESMFIEPHADARARRGMFLKLIAVAWDECVATWDEAQAAEANRRKQDAAAHSVDFEHLCGLLASARTALNRMQLRPAEIDCVEIELARLERAAAGVGK